MPSPATKPDPLAWFAPRDVWREAWGAPTDMQNLVFRLLRGGNDAEIDFHHQAASECDLDDPVSRNIVEAFLKSGWRAPEGLKTLGERSSGDQSGRFRVLFATEQLRQQWRSGRLFETWRAAYPDLFDADDVRLARSQPKYHFYEWLVAIHLLHSENLLSLVEKYSYRGAHPLKAERLERIFSGRPKELEFVHGLRRGRAGVQAPDLLVYGHDWTLCRFVEVKGPGDELSSDQVKSHGDIERKLGVPVETVRVRIAR